MLTIRTYPHPELARPCEPMTLVTRAERDLAVEMGQVMRAAGGIGLAAPQVGYSLPIVVFSLKVGGGLPIAMFAPQIDMISERQAIYEERCLSVPGKRFRVQRPTKIRVTYLDSNSAPQERVLIGLAARVCLHEIDHLRGICLPDLKTPPQEPAAGVAVSG